ncbi:MAG TPA: hypothetical protein VGA62_08590, partial [Acidimicrobiia bacterium]
MQLDLATVLVQWAAGGLFFCWLTTRRREVGLGYGWLLRAVFGAMALLGVFAGLGDHGTGATIRNVGGAVMALAAALSLVVSVVQRGAGVRGARDRKAARARRVAAMIGDVPVDAPAQDATNGLSGGGDGHSLVGEFDPRLDLLAPIAGLVAIAGAASFVGGDYPLALARLATGALFLGAVFDAMLLGHWYLVQPGLARDP